MGSPGSRRALCEAIQVNQPDQVISILDNGADIEDGWGNHSPLMTAAHEGHAQVARVLLERGAHVDAANRQGETALLLASVGGHVDVIAVLIEYGGKLDVPEEYGQTPLMMAFAKGQHEAATRLLDAGARRP